MGAPMALHLQAAGHQLYVRDQKSPPQQLTDGGAVACASSADVARQSDIIITMVPDTPDVEKVLFGRDGVAAGLSELGKLVIDMSSISPLATKNFAERIEALGADYFDAPVSGG